MIFYQFQLNYQQTLMKISDTPPTQLKCSGSPQMRSNFSPSSKQFIKQKQYLVVNISLIDAQIVRSDLFSLNSANISITNSYGITYKTNTFHFQKRIFSQDSQPHFYVNLKRINSIKFYYETEKQRGNNSQYSNSKTKNHKNMDSAQFDRIALHKNNRNIIIRINVAEHNDAENQKYIYSAINPNLFVDPPVFRRKYFSYPLISEEGDLSTLIGHIKIKAKIKTDYSLDEPIPNKSHFIDSNNIANSMIKSIQSIVSPPVIIRHNHFTSKKREVLEEENGLLQKFEMINQKFQNEKSQHEHVSVWEDENLYQNYQNQFYPISECSDEEEY